MENVIIFTRANFFKKKFYLKVGELCPKLIFDKNSVKCKNNLTIPFLSRITILPFWYPMLPKGTQFLHPNYPSFSIESNNEAKHIKNYLRHALHTIETS